MQSTTNAKPFQEFLFLSLFFLFEQVPDVLSFLGYVLIISMGVMNFLYNKKQSENT